MYPMYKQFITPLRRGWDSPLIKKANAPISALLPINIDYTGTLALIIIAYSCIYSHIMANTLAHLWQFITVYLFLDLNSSKCPSQFFGTSYALFLESHLIHPFFLTKIPKHLDTLQLA